MNPTRTVGRRDPTHGIFRADYDRVLQVECFPGRRATLVVLNYMQMNVASEDHQLVHMQLETAIGSSVVE